MSKPDNRHSEGMLQQLETGGWSTLDNMAEQHRSDTRHQENGLLEMADLVEECFSTPAGRQVLEWLVDNTLYRPAWPATMITNADELMTYGIHREGQNSIVAMIENAIAMARREKRQRGEI